MTLDKNNPFISIVIPMYNSKTTIGRALVSIINQTDTRWECILVDNNSQDDTLEICDEICRNENRIRLSLVKSTKRGANHCRNIGWRESKSDYIMFMDADDILADFCIEERIKSIQTFEDSDLYIFNTAFLDTNHNVTGRFMHDDEDISTLICRFIRHDVPWQTMSAIWKKNFLNELCGWNEKYLRLQDVEITIRALLEKPKLHLFKNKPDSFYFVEKPSETKINLARYAFLDLVSDIIPLCLDDDRWTSEAANFISAFSKLLGNICSLYMLHTNNKDPEWETQFLNTLLDAGYPAHEVKPISLKFKSKI